MALEQTTFDANNKCNYSKLETNIRILDETKNLSGTIAIPPPKASEGVGDRFNNFVAALQVLMGKNGLQGQRHLALL